MIGRLEEWAKHALWLSCVNVFKSWSSCVDVFKSSFFIALATVRCVQVATERLFLRAEDVESLISMRYYWANEVALNACPDGWACVEYG
jgi:hypothetical protein